jgi:hypothetical protein
MVKNKGIVVLAQNLSNVNYVEQACALAMSIKVTNPSVDVSIITNDTVPEKYNFLFDQIIPIPFNDDAVLSDWKIENRWKIYHASPYEQTIVMDSDMIVLQDISAWWDYFENYDLYFTTYVVTYRNEKIENDYYRKLFTANYLPSIYTGLHYFKKSEFAYRFYKWLEIITQNWEFFYGNFIKEYYPSRPSMDVTAAIAIKILDCETVVTNKTSKLPYFVHMKPKIQNWTQNVDRWQDYVGVYINKNCEIKIGNHSQNGILHYTEKDFIKSSIIERYRNYLHV